MKTSSMLVLGVACALACATAAAASVTVHWDSSIFAPLGDVTISSLTIDANVHHKTNIPAGRFQGSVTSSTLPSSIFVDSTSDFWAYCADLNQFLTPGHSYMYTTAAPGVRTLDWLGAVNAVLGGGPYAWLHPGSAAIGAAIQLGIWESLYDSSSSWDLSAGTFRATFSNAATATAYAAFRAAVQNPATPDLPAAYAMLLVNRDVQDVITGRRATVPEPDGLALLALGAALAVASLRRKNG